MKISHCFTLTKLTKRYNLINSQIDLLRSQTALIKGNA